MKRILSVFLALVLCLSLFACGKPTEQPPQETEPPAVQPEIPVEPEVPSVPEDSQVSEEPEETEQPAAPIVPQVILGSATTIFKNESDDPVLQVDMTLPQCESLPKIDSYYKAMYDDLTATYGLSQEDAARQRAEDLASGWDFIPWQVQFRSEITRNDGVTLSVLREVYENFGGAHPLITYQAETFDTATQGRLVLGNLFTVSEDEYLARLQDMILVQMDQKETENGVLYYEFAREQLMSLLDPMDFALTEDCLLIFYNEYALAPHAAGLQHFYLPLEQLSDILNPQYLAE